MKIIIHHQYISPRYREELSHKLPILNDTAIKIASEPKYNGTPLALYTFFISLSYISTIEGGKPISAPVDTPNTVIDCISAFDPQ